MNRNQLFESYSTTWSKHCMSSKKHWVADVCHLLASLISLYAVVLCALKHSVLKLFGPGNWLVVKQLDLNFLQKFGMIFLVWEWWGCWDEYATSARNVLIDMFSSSPKKDNAEPQSEKGDEAQQELPTLSSSSTFNFSSSGAHQVSDQHPCMVLKHYLSLQLGSELQHSYNEFFCLVLGECFQTLKTSVEVHATKPMVWSYGAGSISKFWKLEHITSWKNLLSTNPSWTAFT